MEALETQFKVAAATDDKSEAQAAADAMVATHPKLAEGYFDQAAVAESAQRLDDALKLYSAALELQPEASEPLEAMTRVMVKLKRTPEALKRLDAAAAQFPGVPIAPNLKGELLMATQHPADAEIASRPPSSGSPSGGCPIAGSPRHRRQITGPTRRSSRCARRSSRSINRRRCKHSSRSCSSALGRPDDAIRNIRGRAEKESASRCGRQ